MKKLPKREEKRETDVDLMHSLGLFDNLIKSYRSLVIIAIIVILLLVPTAIRFQVVAAPAIGYNILGFVSSSEDSNEFPIPNATVKITNSRTDEYLIVTTDEVGLYLVDLSDFPNKYQVGDMINVTAAFNTLGGYNTGEVVDNQTSTTINITIADITAPDILHVPVSSAVADEIISISAEINDNLIVSDAVVWYVLPGESSYDLSVMTLVAGNTTSGTWEATIPEAGATGSMYYYISANDTTENNNYSDYYEVDVSHGKADHFILYLPTESRAGAEFNVTASIVDKYNNAVSNYTGTVVLWSTDPHPISTMSFGSYQFSSDEKGTHTFQGIKTCTAPSQIIGIYDASNNSVHGNATIMVLPEVPSGLQIIPEEVTMAAGSPSAFSLRLLDEYGNMAPAEQLHSVALSTSSPDGIFSPSGTFDFETGESEKGFLYIDTNISGSPHNLIASASSLAAADAVVNMVSSDADRWTLGPRYVDILAGETVSFSLQLEDSFGNPIIMGNDTLLNLTISSPTGEIRIGDSVIESIVLKANESTMEFNYTDWNIANSPCIIMVGNGTNVADGFAIINITSESPDRLILTPSAIEMAAGTNVTVNVRLTDMYGNPSTGVNINLYVNTTDALASDEVYEFDVINLTGINFSIRLFTMGIHTLVVECYGGMVRDVIFIKVMPGDVQSLKILRPEYVDAGKPFSCVVNVLDGYDNIVANYSGEVGFSSDDEYPAVLPASYIFSTIDGGSRLFDGDFILYTTPSRKITARAMNEDISTTEEISIFDNVMPTAEFNPKGYENNLGPDAEFTIRVSDNIRIEKVRLHYSYDNTSFSYVDMAQATGNHSTGMGNYSVEISGMPSGDMYVYFSVSDGSNVVDIYDNGGIPYIFEVNDESNLPMIYVILFVIISGIIASILFYAKQKSIK